MGSCFSKAPDDVSNKDLPTTGVHLYGDYFDSWTRAIASILDFCDVEFQFIAINILKEEHRNESYLKINDEGTIPTLIIDSWKYTRGRHKNIPFLLVHRIKNVAKRLFPEEAT